MRYDIAIIGTGPAGLEAALNAKIRNKSVLLLGERDLSKKIGAAPQIENYLGFPAAKGEELGKAFAKHIAEMDIEVTEAVVKQIMPLGEYCTLDTTEGMFDATAVVIATGVVTNKTLPGEEEYLGSGVGYCATCDGPLYRGKKVAIIGEIKEADDDAKYMAELAEKVYYIPKYEGWQESVEATGIFEIVDGTPVEIKGAQENAFMKKVETLVVETSDGEKRLDVDGVFFIKAMIPASSLVPGLSMDEEEPSAIKVNRRMETNYPGIFAAGDCTGRPYQYMKAAGEGLVAGQSAVAYVDMLSKK